MELKRQLGLPTATLVVIASMMGTGIFFTTGIILQMTRQAWLVLLLWLLGGFTAICGALCYVELATLWPQTGGEYVYLKKTFGRLPGFLTGWISLIVGFSAPVATSALAFVSYLNAFYRELPDAAGNTADLISGTGPQKLLAAFLVFFFGLLHIVGVQWGSRIQNGLTVLKFLIAASFAAGGLWMADWSQAARLAAVYPAESAAPAADLPIWGLSLLIIMFSYSGWNAASYIAGEIRDPERNLRKALLYGTACTAALYFLLNLVYLIAVPGPDLMGQEAVGALAARHLFPLPIVQFYTLGISLILLSSISVQMMIGPRVYFAMARDRLMFSPLARVHPRLGTPWIAILLQMILAILYIFTGSAQKLLEYMGFALTVFPLLAILGLFFLKRKKLVPRQGTPRFFFPWIPAAFIALTFCMAASALLAWTRTTWFALMVVLSGIPVYYYWEWSLSGKKPLPDDAPTEPPPSESQPE